MELAGARITVGPELVLKLCWTWAAVWFELGLELGLESTGVRAGVRAGVRTGVWLDLVWN